jgi:hypothetical protein
MRSTKRLPVSCRAMTRVLVWALMAVTWLGCGTKANPQLTCSDGTCSNPDFPFCDVNGVVEGEPNTCLAVSCTPGEFAACDGDTELACNTAGDNYTANACPFGCSATSNGCNQCSANQVACVGNDVHRCDASGMETVETCSQGCIDAPTPHCAYLEPRYLPNVCDTHAPNGLTIDQSGTLDVDLDATCNGGVVTQAGGAPICVIHYSTIDIGASATLKVVSSVNQALTGTGRAVALVADGDVVVDGMLDVSADGIVSGPGGGLAYSGGTISAPSGAGGAGFKTAGGAGGSATADGGAANGGVATMDPATLTALIGGPKASGGGGGGAATLISCSGRVSVTGIIDAGGGGGMGGYNLFSTTPGGGGGAGGYVVLQGMDVSVTGEMYANGGGGGAGDNGAGMGTSVQNGGDGTRSESTGAHGGSALSGAGSGGTGGVAGIATRNPGNGLRATTTGNGAGGGGGSVGWFQSYTPNGVTPTLTPSHASPRFQPNANVSLR